MRVVLQAMSGELSIFTVYLTSIPVAMQTLMSRQHCRAHPIQRETSAYRNLLASSAMILNLFNRVNCTLRSNKHGSTTRAMSVMILNAAMDWKSAACEGKRSAVQHIR